MSVLSTALRHPSLDTCLPVSLSTRLTATVSLPVYYCQYASPTLSVCQSANITLPVCQSDTASLPVYHWQSDTVSLCQSASIPLPICQSDTYSLPLSVCQKDTSSLPVCHCQSVSLPVCQSASLKITRLLVVNLILTFIYMCVAPSVISFIIKWEKTVFLHDDYFILYSVYSTCGKRTREE